MSDVMADAKLIPFDCASQLPARPGVYWVTSGARVLYVGQSRNMRARWVFHHRVFDMRELGADRIRWILVDPAHLKTVESELIQRLSPELNGPWPKRPQTVQRSASFTSAGMMKVTILIPVEMSERLNGITQRRHVSKSVLMREAIDELLNKLEVPA